MTTMLIVWHLLMEMNLNPQDAEQGADIRPHPKRLKRRETVKDGES
jgi:hypothetical protein